jgi:hypothetical protein
MVYVSKLVAAGVAFIVGKTVVGFDEAGKIEALFFVCVIRG